MINSYDKEINDFIINVFNYYNGKINIINKAVLDINWTNLMLSQNGGYSRLPNVIVINPVVISRYNEDIIDLKISILATIIHELYHTDQLINYQLYATDINYNKYIEHACELQTMLYAAGHVEEINRLFGLDTVFDRLQFNKTIAYWHTPGIQYQRRYYNDHIFMCIDQMCAFEREFSENLYNAITNAINNNHELIIKINNELIPVNANGELMPIDQFNQYMLKYQCTGVYDCHFEFNYDNGDLFLDMNVSTTNLMCKKV